MGINIETSCFPCYLPCISQPTNANKWRAFRQSYLEGNQEGGKQLQSNTNGLKILPVKYGQGKGLVKRKPFIPDSFSKWLYQTSKFLMLNFNTVLHSSRLLALHSHLHQTVEKQKCFVILNKGGNKHFFHWTVILLQVQILTLTGLHLLHVDCYFPCLWISTGEGEPEMLGWPLENYHYWFSKE